MKIFHFDASEIFRSCMIPYMWHGPACLSTAVRSGLSGEMSLYPLLFRAIDPSIFLNQKACGKNLCLPQNTPCDVKMPSSILTVHVHVMQSPENQRIIFHIPDQSLAKRYAVCDCRAFIKILATLRGD